MFGKILSSTVNICAYEFRVYSFLYVIKYIIVNDYLCHLCGVILTLKNNGCDTNSAPKHQLTDVINSNIQNKNVLNNAEATAISNIPTKASRKMFSPTIFLQYEKDKYESYDNDNSYRKVPATKTYGITTIPGKGNVEYVIVKYLIVSNVRGNLAVHRSVTLFVIRQPIRRPCLLERVYKPMRTSH